MIKPLDVRDPCSSLGDKIDHVVRYHALLITIGHETSCLSSFSYEFRIIKHQLTSIKTSETVTIRPNQYPWSPTSCPP